MPPCVECGYAFREGPVRLAERCRAFCTDVGRVLQVTASDLLSRRPAPRIWSPLEYAAHVSEAVPWYVARIQRVLREPAARFEAFDWDRAAVDGQYGRRSIETVTRDVRSACAAFADVALAVTGADLAKAGIGSDGTPRTVQTLLERAGHELAHHELDIRRGVAVAAASVSVPRPPR